MSTQGFRKSSKHQSRAPANPRSTHTLATGRRHRSVHSPDSEPCCGNTPPFDLKSSSPTAAASSTSCILEVPTDRDHARLHLHPGAEFCADLIQPLLASLPLLRIRAQRGLQHGRQSRQIHGAEYLPRNLLRRPARQHWASRGPRTPSRTPPCTPKPNTSIQQNPT